MRRAGAHGGGQALLRRAEPLVVQVGQVQNPRAGESGGEGGMAQRVAGRLQPFCCQYRNGASAAAVAAATAAAL